MVGSNVPARERFLIKEHLYRCMQAGREKIMAQCEVCGNDYDKAITIEAAGVRHTFDCFECAIQAMAPECEHCQCKIIGHGVEVQGRFFCCAHCARFATSADLRDRVA
jgi:hypothetical protein